MRISLPRLNQLPDLRIDRCVFGLNGELHLKTMLTPADLAKRFASFEQVTLTTPHTSKGDPNYFQATFLLHSDADRDVGKARLDLHFVGSGNGLRLGNRTALHLNPQKLKRAISGGAEVCGEPGFDGSLNVLALHHRGPRLLRALLELAAEVVQFVLDGLTAAAPDGEWKWGKIWLKAVEACRDLRSTDSIADMRILQRTTLAGATMVARDLYRAGTLDQGGIPVVQWMETEDGPRDKAYAKRRDTMRTEVVCKDRTAICRLTGTRQRETVSSQAAVDLLIPFANAAAPRLDTIGQHVAEALAARPATPELLIELAELVAMAAGMRVGNRGPSPTPASLQGARDALGGLFEIGSFDAANAPPALWRVLDQIAAKGVLARHRRRRVYYLHPRFSRGIVEAAALVEAA
jgi:hypothetical protein